MQRAYAAQFSREHGCTLAEWLGWLPRAVGAHALVLLPDGRAEVAIGSGVLQLAWRVLPDRQIALIRLPRLAVDYRFEEVGEAQRTQFMRYFDLLTQRGGG